MRVVLLIAANFLRAQRWPILVLLLWVLVLSALGLAVDVRREREDLLIIFKQLAGYAIAFAIFLGGSAIHNESKSRRILTVLSKGVGRAQYIFGTLTGLALVLLLYCFCMGFTGSWLLGRAGFPLPFLWFLMLLCLLASLLAGSFAVLFSTFLNPLFASLATAVFLGAPAIAALQFGGRLGHFVPLYPLLDLFLKASFETAWRADWIPILLALAEIVACSLLASWIFERRDIAVSVD